MTKKYELTDKTMVFADGTVLHRIKALVDIDIPGRKVIKGDLGGWIEKEYNLSHKGDCWVFDEAKVFDNAKIYGHAQVYGNARVYGNAQIHEKTRVFDNARVYGNAILLKNASISCNARVYGDTYISNEAQVFDSAIVFGNAVVSNNAKIFDNARVFGNAEVFGDAKVFEKARVYGNAWIFDNAHIRGDAEVYDDAKVYGDAWIYGNANISEDIKIKSGIHNNTDNLGGLKMNTLTLNEYQKLAARTINNELTEYEMEDHSLKGMVGEIGEINSLYQKTYQGHDLDYEHVKKELGDLLWFIAEYCTTMEWKLEEVAQLNIDKLRARYPEGFDTERSLHRAEDDI